MRVLSRKRAKRLQFLRNLFAGRSRENRVNSLWYFRCEQIYRNAEITDLNCDNIRKITIRRGGLETYTRFSLINAVEQVMQPARSLGSHTPPECWNLLIASIITCCRLQFIASDFECRSGHKRPPFRSVMSIIAGTG